MDNTENTIGVIESARELRIYNWVHYYKDKKHYDMQVMANHFENNEWENFYPIMITEQWLQRLGFIQTEEGTWSKYCNNVNYYFDELEFHYEEGEDVSVLIRQKEIGNHKECGTVFLRDIKFVHELQNFYYAWTGKELK